MPPFSSRNIFIYMMDSQHEEYMREEALRFVDEVRDTFLCTSDSGHKWGQFLEALEMFDDNIITNEALVQRLADLFHGHENLLFGYRKFVQTGFPQTKTRLQKSREFFEKAREFFGEKHANVYRDLLDSVIAHGHGRLGREELYGKVCLTLTGNAGLFSQFESTFFIDGSEETKQKVEDLRVRIKHNSLTVMAENFEKYESTIKALQEAPPKKLTALHRSCIAEVFGGDYQDFHKDRVLHLLEEKYRKLHRSYVRVALPYMSQIFSRPI